MKGVASLTGIPMPLVIVTTIIRYGLSKEASVADLVAVGLHNPKISSSAVIDLKALLEKQKDYPLLVAIDEVDEW